jgi:hypothetical protein
MAPGPEISGIASGKAAMLWIRSLVIATSAVFSFRSWRFPKIISKAMKKSSKPPATLKAGKVIPKTDRMAAPARAKSAITPKAISDARIDTWLRSSRFMPPVSARNSGANPGGSIVTRMVRKALKSPS